MLDSQATTLNHVVLHKVAVKEHIYDGLHFAPVFPGQYLHTEYTRER